MNLRHHQREVVYNRSARSRFQRGYALVMFALLLVPILLVSGFAVDVGLWYDRAATIRKAADAGALAGVVWLPDEVKAREAALAAIERNGIVPGNGISIDIRPSTANEKRLKVTIRDERVGSFFWKNLGGRDITLQRSSFAEYLLPVPMGSPRNYFGTGPLVASPNTELLFQSINPFCTSKVQGDRHQSGWYDNSNPIQHCAGTTNQGVDGEYLSDGYELYIDTPAGGPGPVEVLLYDPRYNDAPINPAAADEQSWRRQGWGSLAMCPRSTGNHSANSYDNAGGYCVFSTARQFSAPISYWNGSAWVNQTSGTTPSTNYVLKYVGTPDSYLSNSNEEDYTFTLYAENSPFTSSDDVQICQRTFSRTTSFERSYLGSTRWNVLCTFTPSAASGRYILKARNQGPGGTYSTRGNGSNQWGMVARYTGGWTGNLGNGLCDGRTQAICPRVYGKNAISVYANTTAGVAQFFLAEIDPVHAGKKLVIELWDPGEGGSSLRILQPNGANSWSRRNMTWRSFANLSSTPTAGGSGQTIDVTGNVYNGRTLEIEIDLTGYNPPVSNRWWKIEYEFNNPAIPNVTDRTTWTARIEGNPVHLVEEN